MKQSIDKILECLVEISSNKEKSTLELSIVDTLSQIIHCDIQLLQINNGWGDVPPQVLIKSKDGSIVEVESSTVSKSLKKTIEDYLAKLSFSLPLEVMQNSSDCIWPLYTGEICTNLLIFKAHTLLKDETAIVMAVAKLFTNFTDLLSISEKDALTGLYNRRMFDTQFVRLVKEENLQNAVKDERRGAKQSAKNFLGIIDIDHFKRVNDDYGHLFGDEVLLWLAQKMKTSFRNNDALFRYGGEEFAMLLTNTEQSSATDILHRFKDTIYKTAFPQLGHISVSIGFTEINVHSNPTVIFGEADQALYYVKENGRNNVANYHELVKSGSLNPQVIGDSDVDLF